MLSIREFLAELGKGGIGNMWMGDCFPRSNCIYNLFLIEREFLLYQKEAPRYSEAVALH
jgi:hypothetical protein